MSYAWGRSDVAGTWPRPEYLWFVGLLVLAALGGLAMGIYQHERTWTPLQRWYLSAYLRSAIAKGLAFESARYELLYVVHRNETRLAFDADVEPVTTASGEPSFALSEVAYAAGVRRLHWRGGQYRHDRIHDLLRIAIYEDQTLAVLARPALWTALAVVLAGLGVVVHQNAKDARERRHGRRLKGPELVTVGRFNRRLDADGVGFVQASGAIARALGWHQAVRIPYQLEPNHLILMGDTGTGKSALIRQLLQQLDARGDTAIVYDPAREYTGQFYRPERGDLILNPLDARSPSWSPADELRHDAEALTLATSLFPERHDESRFFRDAARRLFAHLLTLRPKSAAELACWLHDEDELDRRVRGTAYAAIINPLAPQQRSGVLGSLNLVADTLNLLPPEDACSAKWSALQWAERRRGWLFLTSSPETRERLIPLSSLWLDMLVLRLMTDPQPHHPRVWFIFDELASLHRLPQLHTAVTENRKSNNPVVLSFQGRSQLETRYGHDAEAMLSQPATKIFLRTTEPRAAEWIAKSIGDIEIERLRESRSSGRERQQSYNLERQVEPLVMASEITGLERLHGFMKVGNLVVRLHFPFIKLPEIQPPFVERPVSRRAVPAAPPDDAPHEMPALPLSPEDTRQVREPRTPSGRDHAPFFQ
jgi:Type IV secretion-system coupling protein DNA-binding domain